MQSTASPTPILPSEYQQVEYILRDTSVGSSSGYNTIGFLPNGVDTLVVRAGFMATAKQSSSSGGYITGNRQNNSGNTVGFGVLTDQNTTYIAAWDGVLCSIEPNGGASIRNTRYDVTVTKTPTGLTITDGTHTANTTNNSPRAMVNNLHVFGISNYKSNGVVNPLWGRIYYLNITEGGVSKVNLVPCKRISDGKVGFYDTVQETFRTSGYYTAGPNV